MERGIELKCNVLGSRSLMVQISTASMNSVSDADPEVINICVSCCEYYGSMQKI